MSNDNIDSFIDLADFGPASSLSPSLSPATSKTPFAQATPSSSVAPQTTIPPSQPSFSGPSHQYGLYKQQTGLVPGAVASTLAVNQANSHISAAWDMGLGSGLSPENGFDFNTLPSQGTSDMDMDFGSPDADTFLFPESNVNSTSIAGQRSPVLPSTQSNVGRMWPGMHQQAALAKAQSEQSHHQQLMQQQQQQQQQQQEQQQRHQAHQHAKRPPKGSQPADPIVEQKITQLLNSMRAKPAIAESVANPMPMLQLPRPKREEDDMDEDEKLLASEEGKKLSSKERRQLRNKVSARAFRSRRKEYISQLESEIANKVTENVDLRAHNRALMDENRRLSDLTRMLLSSPSFSNFLEHLSANPQSMPHPEPQREEEALRQLPKDVNPYSAGQVNQHQVDMAMIPDQNIDFSTIAMDAGMPDGLAFQPQVYNAVVETPAEIDASVLSGKSSNFVTPEEEDEEECKDAVVFGCPEKAVAPETPADMCTPEVQDDDFDEDDETLDLFRPRPAPYTVSSQPTAISLSEDGEENIFGAIESDKVFARYELVEPSEAEVQAAAKEMALLTFERSCSRLEACLKRLESLGFD